MPREYAKGKDFVLMLDLREPGTVNPVWFYYMSGVQTYGESRNDTTSDWYYHHGMGAVEQSVDGTNRVFTTTGNRIKNDAMQEALLSFKRQWDTSGRQINYRYFNIWDGKGEEGSVTYQILGTAQGAPQERSGFAVTFTTNGTPAEYQHDLGPYTVTYNAGDGTGTITDTGEYAPGDVVLVKMADGITPPSGKAFAGWNTTESGTGMVYVPGDMFPVFEDTTLYAQFETTL